MEAPERIYLQAALTEEDDDWDDELGVTWCVDRINDSDVEYVRRDVAARLRDAYKIAWDALMPGEPSAVWEDTAWLAEPTPTPDGDEEDKA